jgi:hypothetical protein
MTETYGCSVRELLPDDFNRMDEVIKDGLNLASGEAPTTLPRVAMEVVESKAVEAVRDALDVDIFELLARAWGKARELHEFTDREKYPPEKTYTAFLGEHDLSTEVHPVLILTIGRLEGPRVRLTVELTAHFRLAELSIREGHIIAVGAGDGSVGAQLKYKDVPLHKELKSTPVKLSKALRLQPPGLAIG